MEAVNGSITMADGAVAQALTSVIRYRAALGVALGGLNAGSGSVSVVAVAGSITDNGDTDKDVTAALVRFSAGTGIGLGANLLDTAVSTVAAMAGSGGIFLADDDALVVGSVGPVTVNRVGTDAATLVSQQQTDALLSGETTSSNGRIVQVTLNGSLTVSQPVNANGAGNILLRAATTTTAIHDVELAAVVQSGSGRITVLANRHVIQQAAGDIITGGGTIDVEATTGSITMVDGAVAQSAGGTIRYLAAQNVAVGGLNAGGSTGVVSVTATAGSITDGGDADKDVTAHSLRLVAGTGIGAGANHLDTAVTAIAAQAAGGGIFLTDDDALTVGAVDSVIAYRVQTSGSTVIITDASLTGETTTAGNGNIVQKPWRGHSPSPRPCRPTAAATSASPRWVRARMWSSTPR